MSAVVHKLDREEWSEYPDESEKIRCDRTDRYQDPECSTRWDEVTCKKCLSSKPVDRLAKAGEER